MAWQQVAAKAAAAIAKEMGVEKVMKGGVTAVAMIPLLLLLPVLIIVALFTGGNGATDVDVYEKAFNTTGCDNEYYYQMEDVRFFDQYTRPDGEEPASAAKLATRLQNDYFIVKPPRNLTGNTADPTAPQTKPSKKICSLRTDEEIFTTLKSKYKVKEELKEEIMDTIMQIRNGRQGFKMPVENPKLLANYMDDMVMQGVELKAKKGTEVLAIADGKIVEIETTTDTYDGAEEVCEDKKCTVVSEKKRKGLTVLIEHEVQKGINKQGDYDLTTMYSYYTNLQNVKLNVGDTIEQSTVIGKNKNEGVYFEIWDKDKNTVDPNRYMHITGSGIGGIDAANVGLPMDPPIPITSEVGQRGLDGFHFGMDMDKGYGSTVYTISDGEVILAGNTCTPDVGKTWCPAKPHPVAGGGNFVVVKSNIGGTDYYIQYAHMMSAVVREGDQVTAGQTIGFQGNSGNSYGSHLHLEIHTGGINTADEATVINPRDLIKFQ